jgi:hypothetical protein
MPLLGSFGAASKAGFGRGGASPILFHYVVQAGGASGAYNLGGGGGAGGMRTSYPGGTEIELGSGSYPIVVGAGGAFSPSGGNAGISSSFETITSAQGATGGIFREPAPAGGGSGGGGGGSLPGEPNKAGSSGNVPAVTPSQGSDGYTGAGYIGGGGGGSGNGGAGTLFTITGSPVRSGGGGGAGSDILGLAAGTGAANGGANGATGQNPGVFRWKCYS